MSFELANKLKSSPLGSLPNGWNLVELKDVTTKIGSGATPRGGSSVYLSSRKNYALIRSQHVFDRRFDSEGLVFITNEHATELQKVAVQPRDVLLNITGDGITFGRACIAPKDVLPACVNQHVSIIRTDPKVCLPEYLLCYLTHPTIKGYIESFNAGGSRRAITKGHIESFEVPLPPLDEQKAIAHILGTLDDKIELNQQMNQTLEAIQWTLFKFWFTEGDFPDDWQLLSLEKCMEAIIDYRGKTPRKTDSGIPLITAKVVKKGRISQPQEFIALEDYDDWMRRGIPKCGDVVMTTEAPLGEIAKLNKKKLHLHNVS